MVPLELFHHFGMGLDDPDPIVVTSSHHLVHFLDHISSLGPHLYLHLGLELYLYPCLYLYLYLWGMTPLDMSDG